MTGPVGEMPFLEHLEELRSRILRSLAALVIAFALGLWVVQRFQLVALLKQPIAPYLTGGKLVVLSPTEPVMIVLKLGFVVGLVLASPVIVWQLWAFVAPALYQREKRVVVPALFGGLGLFLLGAALAWAFVVPKALAVLFSFQTEAIAPFITYDAYFGFIIQLVLALGISFELPLVMLLLAWVGVATPERLHRFRRFAVVLACIAGALLSPGADLLSMVMLTVPLVLLYEVGFLGAVLIHRRRRAAAAAALVVGLALGAPPAAAQVPGQQPGAAGGLLGGFRPGQGPGIGQIGPGQPLDTATARILGFPTAPTRKFGEADSTLAELLRRSGYKATRYSADSAVFFAPERRIRLEGRALTEQQGITLEADTVTYQEASCVLEAAGGPHLFDKGQILVGGSIAYNTCTRRGVIKDALTNFSAGSSVWFLRGNVAADSSAKRIYASSSEITSCDLPTPHYHFSAKNVKWVSENSFVARPIVLYVRDVPILWLPFIYQDIRPGRRSGILIPQFGVADIIRTSSGYQRQISNIGYYWAANDYLDLTARVDWFSGRYVQFGVSGQYNVLDRFLSGSAEVSRQLQSGGGGATSLRWDHRQQFNLSTSLTFNVNYVSNTFVVRSNALDPLRNTQLVSSSANLTRRFSWGQLTLGATRRQNLNDNSSQSTLPSLDLAPKPLDIARNITWSPGFTLRNELNSSTPLPDVVVTLPDGTLDTLAQTGSSRATTMNLATPFRFGSFNWQNSVNITDRTTTARQVVSFGEGDPASPDPTDSVSVVRTFPGDFSTGIDWQTGINLPVLFQRTWKLTPTLGIANTTAGPFAIRNRTTGGAFVLQGKRFNFLLNASPTFFGFFPGFGPLSRIRHSISPLISYSYSPAANIPEDFARAITQPGQALQLRSDPTQTLSLALNQTFEGKGRPQPGDTVGNTARKLRLLSINTSAITYDFEQAKKPGQNGWRTQTLTNSVLSDLVPGFNLSLTHDLWRGQAGSDTADFDPFLSSLQTNFTLTENTFRAIGSVFGLGRGKDRERRPDGAVDAGARGPTQPSAFFSGNQGALPRGPFQVRVSYTLSRTRQIEGREPTPARKNLRFSTGFSPTRYWAVSWDAQYNLTEHRFESHQVRLQRDLHEWRAAFNFTRNANGNFAVFFSIFLTDLPELKFDYNQSTFER
ncbi:MAG TPA: twin-arginine translocase subunit TatC [Gemmatimonadales bacterium]|nr:twin-arginine translocase subunit TatC [Gemmatimonadales bacterium]